ncbi:phosphoribosyltransferase [Arthrobacter sp. H14]|uniref:phosphoribosyltransferase n=1 Tax=Arthrobacter sp. H14 TaxID=1312959 RepID=UPI00047AAA0B|nr:phosphoribosyltransferase family protein [Arthrobacter sp. H14]
MRQRYRDRQEAGQALAADVKQALAQEAPDRPTEGRPLVLALPRGGLPVAAEVAEALGAELDVLVVRKVGVPAHPELAMGALALLADTVEVVRNDTVLEQLPGADKPGGAFDTVATTEREELLRREETYRSGRPPVDLIGRAVIIVDDGLATGSTMKAALIAARRYSPGRLVAAIPVGARQTCTELQELADDVICTWATDDLGSVGSAYEKFTQTTNEEVREILDGH